MPVWESAPGEGVVIKTGSSFQGTHLYLLITCSKRIWLLPIKNSTAHFVVYSSRLAIYFFLFLLLGFNCIEVQST